MARYRFSALNVSKRRYGFRVSKVDFTPEHYRQSQLFYDCADIRWYVHFEPDCQCSTSMALVEHFVMTDAKTRASDG
jgi:hypothetical protein